jgi:CheY-like chemotaxis protein
MITPQDHKSRESGQAPQLSCNIILAGREEQAWVPFSLELLNVPKVSLNFYLSGSDALAAISKNNQPDVVICDEVLGDMTGLEFINKLLSIAPMVNSAVISGLDHDDFHEESEGLGIMMQLPLEPDRKSAIKLIEKLRKIYSLSSNIK